MFWTLAIPSFSKYVNRCEMDHSKANCTKNQRNVVPENPKRVFGSARCQPRVRVTCSHLVSQWNIWAKFWARIWMHGQLINSEWMCWHFGMYVSQWPVTAVDWFSINFYYFNSDIEIFRHHWKIKTQYFLLPQIEGTVISNELDLGEKSQIMTFIETLCRYQSKNQGGSSFTELSVVAV